MRARYRQVYNLRENPMTYRGQFRNGVVVFEQPPPLAEGASVEVAALEDQHQQVEPVSDAPTWAEVLKDFIGKAKGLPADMARNHDHYIHGTRKR